MKNDFPVYVQGMKKNIVFNWKHGIPHIDVKNRDDLVIDIIIFRSLDNWLVSMFKNVYHLEEFDDFNKFLLEPQKIGKKVIFDYKTNKRLNYDDEGKTIFEIRYFKFNKIMEYMNNTNNVVIVSLEYLQNKNNALFFLKKLNDTFMNRNKEDFISDIKYHTKKKIITKNRNYSDINIEDYRYIIDEYKNSDIENFINNLEFEIKSFES